MLDWLHQVLAGQTGAQVAVVDEASSALTRGGLATVAVVLLLGLVGLFALRERQLAARDAEKQKLIDQVQAENRELRQMFVAMVEKQTAGLVEHNITSRQILQHIERTRALMEKP